ncbi:hypothetical protein ABK905_21380 [Acerihabitans sp. KWT182]|uniref:Uncharacterized protein n=1 Tax=Acerihabitans sp. KWT182 TaxID=3157919 RepID=A0AAU7Q9Z8_9GAMM
MVNKLTAYADNAENVCGCISMFVVSGYLRKWLMLQATLAGAIWPFFRDSLPPPSIDGTNTFAMAKAGAEKAGGSTHSLK